MALVVEIVGSLALIFGFGTRWAALALAFFALVASFFFHNYWAVPAEQVMVQQMMFFKNMATVGGGFLILAASGAGARRLDASAAPENRFLILPVSGRSTVLRPC